MKTTIFIPLRQLRRVPELCEKMLQKTKYDFATFFTTESFSFTALMCLTQCDCGCNWIKQKITEFATNDENDEEKLCIITKCFNNFIQNGIRFWNDCGSVSYDHVTPWPCAESNELEMCKHVFKVFVELGLQVDKLPKHQVYLIVKTFFETISIFHKEESFLIEMILGNLNVNTIEEMVVDISRHWCIIGL